MRSIFCYTANHVDAKVGEKILLLSHKKITASQWSDYISSNHQTTEFGEIVLADSIITHAEQRRTLKPLGELLITQWQTHRNKVCKEEPFFVSITGSVASGKSTTAQCLKNLLQAQPPHPAVSILCTDDFLYSNHRLEELGILDRKGFPESYDSDALLRCITALKKGVSHVTIPKYSHKIYNIIDNKQVLNNADIIIIEGLNILQRATNTPTHTIDQLTNICIYMEAAECDLFTWFTKRIKGLIEEAKKDKSSFYHRFSKMSLADVSNGIHDAWYNINSKNLHENLIPLREKADIIMEKNKDHQTTALWVKI